MYKYLLFSEPQSLVFYSSATALAQHSSYYFVATKMKQLIFRSTAANSVKATLPLTKALQLSRSETVNLMHVLSLEEGVTKKGRMSSKGGQQGPTVYGSSNENESNMGNMSRLESASIEAEDKQTSTCSLLLGTSKLNFYVMLIDLHFQEIREIQKVQFGYKSSLKRLSSNSKLVALREGLTLLVSANFVFYLTSNEPRFKLLKIMKEKVLSLEVGFQNKDELYILGKKQLIFGKLETIPGGRISFQESRTVANKRKFIGMKAMRKKLVFFNKHRQLRIFELDKEDFTHKIEVFQSFKQPLDFGDVHVINGDILAVHDQKYLYCLSLKMNRVWQIVNLSDSHFAVLPDGQILTLQPKSENLFSVAQVHLKTYQKANKINKYLALSKYEKLKVIFGYLTRKFLKLFKFQDYNKVIYDLLLKMNLSNGLIKQPEFKAEVLKLYNLITDFSVKVDRSAVKASKDSRVKTEGGSVYGSSHSRRSSTSPSPQSSPKKKKKNLNYLVVKPFVEIRLPRKNNINEMSEEALMKKIMCKGSRHYSKFIDFRRKDNTPSDSIDSVYARYQSRLIRIQKGKFYVNNLLKYLKKNVFELVGHLFFICIKFNMKNNVKYLHCLIMGFDLDRWMSPVNRKVHYQVLLDGVNKKAILNGELKDDENRLVREVNLR